MKIVRLRDREGNIIGAKKSKDGRYCIFYDDDRYDERSYKILPYGYKELKCIAKKQEP